MSRNDWWKRRSWRVCRCGQVFDVPNWSKAMRCGDCEVKRFLKVVLFLAAVAVPVLAALYAAGVL